MIKNRLWCTRKVALVHKIGAHAEEVGGGEFCEKVVTVIARFERSAIMEKRAHGQPFWKGVSHDEDSQV